MHVKLINKWSDTLYLYFRCANGNSFINYRLLVLHLTGTEVRGLYDLRAVLLRIQGVGWVVADISKEIMPPSSGSSSPVLLEWSAAWTWGKFVPAVSYLATRRHIPDDLHPGRYEGHGIYIYIYVCVCVCVCVAFPDAHRDYKHL
jgi:hypothetical protein